MWVVSTSTAGFIFCLIRLTYVELKSFGFQLSQITLNNSLFCVVVISTEPAEVYLFRKIFSLKWFHRKKIIGEAILWNIIWASLFSTGLLLITVLRSQWEQKASFIFCYFDEKMLENIWTLRSRNLISNYETLGIIDKQYTIHLLLTFMLDFIELAGCKFWF